MGMEALYKVQGRSSQKDTTHPAPHTHTTLSRAMVFDTSSQSSNSTSHQSEETVPGSPPKYNDAALDSPIDISSSTPPATSVPFLPNVTYEENEYGEMQPTKPDAIRARIPSGTTFQENEYGEIHRAEMDPDLTDSAQTVSATSGAEGSTEPRSDHFGEDTTEKAIEYRSDDVYAENRYGELGRADTYYGNSVNLSDKIKGTAEQFIGKITGNKELHDKGILHKEGSPTS